MIRKKGLPSGDEASATVDEFVSEISASVYNKLVARFGHDSPQLRTLGSPSEIADRLVASLPRNDFWDENVGPFYDTAGLIAWLGVTRQTLHYRAKSGRILGVKTADGALLYPSFQFGPAGEPLPHLPELLRMLAPIADDTWDSAIWLNTSLDANDDRTAAEALRDGDIEQVLAAAARDGRVLES